MQDAENIWLDRAYRLGQRQLVQIKPIVATFNFQQDRKRLVRQAKELKGTRIAISEKFQREINEKRKVLL